ncbi:hypothetical protein EYF80_059714 [Liparis tanakae]|uniref:Uncharacterized protein n=1 Tax=Liparis tanakae TaxID=230148 RepID=A0A4Z2EN13_9TELE|nr:hypothetical protein EYF80_059714 [Liparis tanakae]
MSRYAAAMSRYAAAMSRYAAAMSRYVVIKPRDHYRDGSAGGDVQPGELWRHQRGTWGQTQSFFITSLLNIFSQLQFGF